MSKSIESSTDISAIEPNLTSHDSAPSTGAMLHLLDEPEGRYEGWQVRS